MGTEHTSTSDLWAGVDVGTQSLRVLLADDHGVVVGRGAGRLDSHRSGPVHEQDPEQWWQVLGQASREALANAEWTHPQPARLVRGLAICGTSGTFLLASDTAAPAKPLTPALMYDDGRAADDWTGPGQPSWPRAKLAWLAEHGSAPVRAGLTAGRVRLEHCPDFLAARLVGHPVATDWSHALKTGYDPAGQAWPAMSPVPSGVLPDVVRPGTLLGRIDAYGAAHTGFAAGTPVRAGMTDGCAAQIAAGALTLGSWNAVLGTTLVLKGVTEHRLNDPAGAVYSHRHPDHGWLPGGASSVGAGTLALRFPGANRARRDAAAARFEPAGGIVYPLTGRGERFPFVRPDAEAFEAGAFVDDDERYAATLQAVAYVEKLAYAHMRRIGARIDGPHYITGGGTRSRYWCQLRADVLGHELVLPANAEPAFGMAVLAAAGDDPLVTAAGRMIRPGTVVAPRPGATARFTHAYANFLDALVERDWIDAALADYAKNIPLVVTNGGVA
ncbi:FGGY-family carbohydrate kinase [Micromonospora eburnea]|uniref:Sugar (Pentulose or hexulose) kinase n=1 Tax=Micromonospora eburnea TaxID=227316 RepID=A0A1C6URB9_9ACTN|nr:FGGY-family carbohydrate kinase [Micromonospora eburnea]SCL56423.1 Sugar (pentulose or hexulose) kinase [Micromonospora eburnea]